MSKLEDFEDLPYEKELRYTEEDLMKEKARQKEEMDYSVNTMKEEFEKQLRQQNIKYTEKINNLKQENEFYKNIIKRTLHI